MQDGSEGNWGWELWYQDLFDRECPRQVAARGERLVEGLAALWRHFLLEGLTAEGGKGFAGFNLWWVGRGQSTSIQGDWGGLLRLRAWVLGSGGEPGDEGLLRGIAAVHGWLVLAGESSEAIARLAADAGDRQDFEERLKTLGPGRGRPG